MVYPLIMWFSFFDMDISSLKSLSGWRHYEQSYCKGVNHDNTITMEQACHVKV